MKFNKNREKNWKTLPMLIWTQLDFTKFSKWTLPWNFQINIGFSARTGKFLKLILHSCYNQTVGLIIKEYKTSYVIQFWSCSIHKMHNLIYCSLHTCWWMVTLNQLKQNLQLCKCWYVHIKRYRVKRIKEE